MKVCASMKLSKFDEHAKFNELARIGYRLPLADRFVLKFIHTAGFFFNVLCYLTLDSYYKPNVKLLLRNSLTCN